MSLSWRDRYVAVLTPERVLLVRRRRGWNGAWDLRLDAPCPDPGAAAAVRSLAGLLEVPEMGRGEIDLILSNHFVRYLLVPWRDEVGTPGELEAYAQVCCDQVYGGGPARRVLRLSRERAGRPRLAAFVEADFLAGLEGAVAASRLATASIRPYLAAAFNRLSRALPRGDFLFLVAEPARTCLLAAAGGAWSAVRAGAGEDGPRALAHFIRREIQLLGYEADTLPPVFLHAPRHARPVLTEWPGIAPTVLPVPIPAALAATADHLLAMAMAA